MGLSSILSTPLVLEDTIESVKSVGSKESSPNSISRNHSIEPMVPQPSFELTTVERGKLFEIKIDLVTTDPRAGPEVMRGGPFHWPAGRGSSSQPGPREGKRTKRISQVQRFHGPTFKILPPSSGQSCKEQISPASPALDTAGPHVSVYFISARSGISPIP